MSAPRAVVFDFDKSLVDANTDEWVPKCLGPKYLEVLRQGWREKKQWTELCDHVAASLHADGLRRADIERALCTIPVQPAMLHALREAAAAGLPVHIVSDANEVYIQVLLEHLGIAGLVQRVVTNPAHWGANERLHIRKYVDGVDRPAHGCDRCPVNMCKRRILADELALLGHAGVEILYVGDGSGDVCPCLHMHAGCVVCARVDHPMLKELQPLKDSGALAAQLVPWGSGDDVLAAVRAFIARPSTSASAAGGAAAAGEVAAAADVGAAVGGAGAAAAPVPPPSSSVPASSASPSLALPSPIVLLGDSTLDNIVWVEHTPGAAPVKTHLERLTGSAVLNYAADGFTSEDVLIGAPPRISSATRARTGDPFPDGIGASRVFKPLDALDAVPGIGAGGAAVLSVGGNDVRHILTAMHLLPVKLGELQRNYPAIIERVLKATPRVVIMMQYRPALDADDGGYGVYRAISSVPGPGTAVQKLNGLLQMVYEPILALARAHGLPVIDLPNSLDPRDGSLFCCQIEPSDAGGKRIARLIAHVLAHHKWAAGESVMYSEVAADAGVDAKPNAPGWRVTAAPLA